MKVVDWDMVRVVAEEMRSAQLTITDISKMGGVTRRTAYRWLDLIQESGADVVRRSRKGEAETYQIVGAFSLG